MVLNTLIVMRLNDPGSVSNAIENIRNLRSQLGNSRSAMSAEGKRDNFVNWCEDRARDVLVFLFDPSEAIFDELEVAYIRAATSTMTEPRLLALMNREFTRWSQNLDRIEADLLEQQRFLSIPGHRIVLDTSALMECHPSFASYDWHSVRDDFATGDIRLILPIIVIDELDELLHSPNGERRRKAREATRQLRTVHGDRRPSEAARLPDSHDVTLEVDMEPRGHVRLPSNDAEVIDRARQLHRGSGHAVLGTCDMHMSYRARAMDLPVVLLPRKDVDSTTS